MNFVKGQETIFCIKESKPICQLKKQMNLFKHKLKIPQCQQYLNLPSPFQSAQKPQFQHEDFSFHEPKVNVSSFQQGINSSPQRKAKIGQILQKWIEQQTNQEQKSFQSESVNDTFISQSSEAQNSEKDRQKRRMRRQIKKLNAKLDFEKKINLYAKEGLLISEEQNYQFRLKIKQLQKSQYLQIFNQKDAEAKLLEQLDHQKQIKEEYLQSCLLLKEQNEKLQQQNIFLSSTLRKMNQGQSTQQNGQSILMNGQLFDRIKKIAFSISNCIPITKQSKNVQFFQPQDETQLLQTLDRVYIYCKEIEKRQQQKNILINKQKQLFIKFIVEISKKIDKLTKKEICQQMATAQQMTKYIKLLKNDQQTGRYSISMIASNENEG